MRKELSETDLAYFAGFLDGEGCFRINDNKSPVIEVSHTFLPILIKLQDAFGGSVRNKTRCNQSWRNAFLWRVYGPTAKTACEQLVPFLLEKKEQAQLLVDFHNLSSRDKVTTNIPQKLKELKKIEYPVLSRPISNPANVQQTKARRNLRDVAGDRRPCNSTPNLAMGARQRRSTQQRREVRTRAS